MVPPADEEFPKLFRQDGKRSIKFLKSAVYFDTVMRPLGRAYTSPIELSRLSLGALGNLLEFTIHNQMHMRWASLPRDAHGNVAQRGDFDFSEKWDDPAYDYLGDFYSSHVNPLFWRSHGWVDERIEDWFQAHEALTPGEVQRQEHNGISWYDGRLPGRRPGRSRAPRADELPALDRAAGPDGGAGRLSAAVRRPPRDPPRHRSRGDGGERG